MLCHVCGKEMSATGSSCPHCGATRPEAKPVPGGKLTAMAIIGGVVLNLGESTLMVQDDNGQSLRMPRHEVTGFAFGEERLGKMELQFLNHQSTLARVIVPSVSAADIRRWLEENMKINAA